MADDLFALLDPLAQAGFRYAVSGSVAAMAYGEPRLTHDIDVVLDLRAEDAERLEALYRDHDGYVPPAEIIAIEAQRERRGHFNLLGRHGAKADIYPVGRDPLNLWALQGRRAIPIGSREVWFAAPEYVILRKLEYHREGGSEKHLRDIEGILRTCGDTLDRAELQRRVTSLGLDAMWEGLASARSGS